MSEVILVRPGYTDFDEQCRIQGLLDLPLNERGQRYVEELVGQLSDLDVDVILTDPGEPARTTAEALGDALDVSVKDVPDLRNLDLGLWQGLQLDEVRRKYPKLLKQWHEHPETICPPQGEPVCEAMTRIAQALKKPLRKHKRVVIVAADPLATLIAGVIRGTKPDFTGPMCSHAGRCVETLNDDALATVVPTSDVPTANGLVNGHPTNGRNSPLAGGSPNDETPVNGQPLVNGAAAAGSRTAGMTPVSATYAASENDGHELRV
ncbi:MAG: histidine phosphatase family protein [Planctomycetaceae bacterium]